LPQLTWLELSRLAVAPDAPPNTASRMLGWMARDIRKRFPEVIRLVSYQAIDHHTGGIYRAAGWIPTLLNDGEPWYGRPGRSKDTCPGPKQRWEKAIRED
jgi:hypothetical protein